MGGTTTRRTMLHAENGVLDPGLHSLKAQARSRLVSHFFNTGSINAESAWSYCLLMLAQPAFALPGAAWRSRRPELRVNAPCRISSPTCTPVISSKQEFLKGRKCGALILGEADLRGAAVSIQRLEGHDLSGANLEDVRLLPHARWRRSAPGHRLRHAC